MFAQISTNVTSNNIPHNNIKCITGVSSPVIILIVSVVVFAILFALFLFLWLKGKREMQHIVRTNGTNYVGKIGNGCRRYENFIICILF